MCVERASKRSRGRETHRQNRQNTVTWHGWYDPDGSTLQHARTPTGSNTLRVARYHESSYTRACVAMLIMLWFQPGYSDGAKDDEPPSSGILLRSICPTYTCAFHSCVAGKPLRGSMLQPRLAFSWRLRLRWERQRFARVSIGGKQRRTV